MREHDEPRFKQRFLRGHEKYGDLILGGEDKRNWIGEANEELDDAIIYLGIAKLERKLEADGLI